jgi:transposase
VVLRRELRRQQLEGFFAKLPRTEVVLEACGGSHHWGRVLMALGRRVRLIPPRGDTRRRPNQRAELRPHCGCLAVQVEASSRRLARPDTEAEVDGRQATAGRISRQGDERLRQLLVLGATVVVRTVKPGSRHASA